MALYFNFVLFFSEPTASPVPAHIDPVGHLRPAATAGVLVWPVDWALDKVGDMSKVIKYSYLYSCTAEIITGPTIGLGTGRGMGGVQRNKVFVFVFMYCWGWVDICVSKQGYHWVRYWLAACSAPSHYLNQCCFFFNLTLMNKFQWNFNKNKGIFILKKCIKICCLPYETWWLWSHVAGPPSIMQWCANASSSCWWWSSYCLLLDSPGGACALVYILIKNTLGCPISQSVLELINQILSKLIFSNFKLKDPRNTFTRFISKLVLFHSRKCIWKCFLKNLAIYSRLPLRKFEILYEVNVWS